MIADIAPGNISIKHGFMGPNLYDGISLRFVSQCIDRCHELYRLGYADVIVTGGSEAAVTNAGMGGFNAMHALSTRNEIPRQLRDHLIQP